MTAAEEERSLARAEHLLDLKRPADAERVVRDLLTSTPNHSEALHLLGRALNLQDRNPEAETSLRAALALTPESDRVMVSLSEVLFELGRHTEATATAWRAVQQDPQWWVNHYQYARGLLAGNRSARRQAHRVTQECVRLAPHSADAHNLHGMALDEAGRRKEARAAYLRAVELNPDHAHALNNLAVLDNSLWRVGHATRSLRQALALDPSDPTFRSNLGILMGQLAFRLLVVLGSCALVLIVLLATGTPRVWRALVGAVLLLLIVLIGRASWQVLPTGLRQNPRALLGIMAGRAALLSAALLPVSLLVGVLAFGPAETALRAGETLGLLIRFLAIIGIVLLVIRAVESRKTKGGSP